MKPASAIGARWIIAEYCDADLFTGWHLYERDRYDGSPNEDGDWGWLRRGNLRLRFEIAQLFPLLPQPVNVRDTFDEIEWHNRFVEAFAANYPEGVRVLRATRSRMYALDRCIPCRHGGDPPEHRGCQSNICPYDVDHHVHHGIGTAALDPHPFAATPRLRDHERQTA